MNQLLHEIVAWFMAFMSQNGYTAVVLALFLEGAWVPITSEVFLLAAGFLAWEGRLSLWLVAFLGSLGFSVGVFIPYLVGRYLGKEFLLRYGRYIFLTEKDVAGVEWWFRRYGEKAILLTRCLPVVRNAISLPAGMARLPLGRFWTYTFLGFFPWALAVTGLGFLAGANWEKFRPLFNRVDDVMLTVLLVALGGLWLWLYLRRQRRDKTG